LHLTVRFHEHIGLDAEREIDVGRVLRINAQILDAPYFRTSRITDRRARFQPARELKMSMVGFGRATKRSIDRENRDKKDASGSQDKQSHQRLFGFWAHHSPYSWAPLFSGSPIFRRRSSATPVLSGERLQIIQFPFHVRLGHSIQKLTHAWLRARPHFL